MGGSDQLGNIVTGYELIRKSSKEPIFGLLTPLVTNEAGDKYGKSTGTPIWLDRDKLSAFGFYQVSSLRHINDQHTITTRDIES